MIIVILGAGINEKGKLSKDTTKRLREGHELYKKHNSPLLLSGKYSFPYDKNNPPDFTEAEVMHSYLVNFGVDKENILLDKESLDNVSSAYRAKTKFFIPQKETEAIIVTSDIHLERIEYIFNKVFGESYTLHFLALPSSFPCGGKSMVMAKQNMLTEKVKNLLEEVKSGDHEFAMKKISQSSHQKENPFWKENFDDYRKTC